VGKFGKILSSVLCKKTKPNKQMSTTDDQQQNTIKFSNLKTFKKDKDQDIFVSTFSFIHF